MRKYKAVANKIASDSFGLNKGETYIIETNSDYFYVYNLKGTYITSCRTDAFDNYEDITFEQSLNNNVNI